MARQPRAVAGPPGTYRFRVETGTVPLGPPRSWITLGAGIDREASEPFRAQPQRDRMRAFLLVLLGVCVVWFAWRGLGGRSDARDSAAAAPGTMIALDAPAAAPGPAEGVADPAAPAAAAPAAGEVPAAAEPAAAPRAGAVPAADTATAPPKLPVAPANRLAEAGAAAALLADPDGFCGLVDSGALAFDGGRRELALALGHALAGRKSQAAEALARIAESDDVQATERELAIRLATDGASFDRAALDGAPLARAASMLAAERGATAAAQAGRAGDAARAWSTLLLAELSSPWPADAVRLARWSTALRTAQSAHRWNRKGPWASIEIEVQPGDSLISVRKRAIAMRPDLVVCTGQIARANELSGDVIRPGQVLRVPTDTASVIVDLSAHWALYLLGDEVVDAWPVGVGKQGSETQEGTFTVGEKKENPMWFPVGRQPVPHGDPENPLGTRWIAWLAADGRTTGLGFHGTNEPDSIGGNASLGCIRMRDADVEALFEILPRGAQVHVRP